MKKIISVFLSVAMALTLAVGLVIPASATPGVQNGDSLSITQPGGGAYIHVTNLTSGEVQFNYGWDNSKTFANPVGSYWIGVYDVTASHYVWVTGWINYSDSKLKLSQTVDMTGVASGDFIKFVFFVNDQPAGAGNHLVDLEYAPPTYNTVTFTAP